MKYASDFRKTAREALKGKWGLAVGVGLVASILGGSGSGASFNVNIGSSGSESSETYEGIFSQLIEDNSAALSIIISLLSAVALVALVIGIAMFVLGSIVNLGYAKFNLELIDDGNPAFNNLFAYFKHWKVAIISNLLMGIFVFLWTLLFIIPGIIAAYSYAMTPYILADNPELSAREAIKMSKEMMRGNKWRLFCLGFSFIGWIILGAFTFGIGYLWLNPYIAAANADFYREISGTRPVLVLEAEEISEQL